jgi:hypothetical protein
MKRTLIRSLLALGLTVQGLNLLGKSNSPLVVHEWGTFTSLQDEGGQTIGGINTDDEPVPKFVHRLADFLLLRPTEVPGIFFQGAPHCHPDVTLRLETPVLYFHLPYDPQTEEDLSVTASFRGGWLSEFYPNADVSAPGLVSNTMTFGPLRPGMMSTLSWNHLDIGGNWPGPLTTQHVWTSPRAVQAANIRTTGGEAEKFLFYRGVAHIDAPISVVQDENNSTLVLRSQCAPEVVGQERVKVNFLWLVDIAENSKVAFRQIPSALLGGEAKALATVSSHFSPTDYSEGNRDQLKSSLLSALVSEGLFKDEAQALLNTWELSYLKSPGMRIFFMVPRKWTDYYLPLKLSKPAEVTRVMVGRIEVLTAWQKNYLRQIAQASTNSIRADAIRLRTDFYAQIGKKPNEMQQVDAGQESLDQFGISVPRTYQCYLALGRFRNALVLEEARKHPSTGLDAFISTYALQGYKPVEVSTRF